MKNTCRERFNFIYDFDLFGKTPELYYKGRKKEFLGLEEFLQYFI